MISNDSYRYFKYVWHYSLTEFIPVTQILFCYKLECICLFKSLFALFLEIYKMNGTVKEDGKFVLQVSTNPFRDEASIQNPCIFLNWSKAFPSGNIFFVWWKEERLRTYLRMIWILIDWINYKLFEFSSAERFRTNPIHSQSLVKKLCCFYLGH